MSIIWILLAVVYTKSSVVVDRKEGDPKLHNSRSEFKLNQSILRTEVFKNNKNGDVQPFGIGSPFQLLFKENLLSQVNADAFDENHTNPANHSEKQNTTPWTYTTPSKLYSKSIKTMSDFKSSYSPNSALNLFNNSTSRSFSEKKLSLRKPRYNSTSSNPSEIDTAHSNSNDGILKERSFEIPHTEDEINQSRKIDIGLLNFNQNTRAPIIRNDLEPESQEHISKKVLKSISTRTYLTILGPTSQRLQFTSYNGNYKFEYTREPKDMKAETIDENCSASKEVGSKRKRHNFNFETVPNVFVNVNTSHITTQQSPKKKRKKKKREYENTFNRKLTAKISQYEEFDWYENDDVYGHNTDGTSGKFGLTDEELKKLESILPEYHNKNTSEKDQISAQYLPYLGYENELSTGKYDWGSNYYYTDEENDTNTPLYETESVNKPRYWKKSKKKDYGKESTTATSYGVMDAIDYLKKVYSYNRYRAQLNSTEQTISGLEQVSNEDSNKNINTWVNWASKIPYQQSIFEGIYEETSSTFREKHESITESFWEDILFLRNYSYVAEPSRKLCFINWKNALVSTERASSELSTLEHHDHTSTTVQIKFSTRGISKVISTGTIEETESISPNIVNGKHTECIPYLSDTVIIEETKTTSQNTFYEKHTCSLPIPSDGIEDYDIPISSNEEITEYNDADDECTCGPELEGGINNDPNFIGNDLSKGVNFYYDLSTETISPKEFFKKIESNISTNDEFYDEVPDYESYENREMENEYKTKHKGYPCSSFQILPSSILLVCTSWLQYYTSLAK